MENNNTEEYGFTCFAVGEKFNKVMKQDGAIIELYDDCFVIHVAFTDIRKHELFDFTNASPELYLSVIEGIVFVTAAFGESILCDMPFNVGLYKEFTLKDPGSNGFLIPAVLIENRTNIIKGLRVIGVDPKFGAQLYKAVKKQWDNPIPNYDERLKSVYDRYSPQDIMQAAIRKNRRGD